MRGLDKVKENCEDWIQGSACKALIRAGSYRELELLGRPLTPEEAREVMNMARRIAAIVLLAPALDANYQAVKAATYSWPSVP